MKIELLDLTVREIVEDYEDAGEGGVTGYGGKLDIRPPFQREFIYNDKERNAVIDSIPERIPVERDVLGRPGKTVRSRSLTDSSVQSPLLSMWMAISRSKVNTSTISHQTNKN